jgi:hypothetical protein
MEASHPLKELTMRKDTQKLAAWAKDKPLGVTLPAILAASSTEDVRQFLHKRRSRKGIFASRPAIDETLWLRFYRSPKSLERTLLAELGVPEDSAAKRVFDALRNPRRATPIAIQRALGVILAAFSQLDHQLHEELIDATLAGADVDDGAFDITQPATAFFFWVYLPCWLVYGVTPWELLRRVSRDGKPAEQAARQLVRLDGTASLTVAIQRWARADGANGAYRHKKLRKWASQTPFDKEKAPSRALKIVTARISYLSELLDQRLNVPDLRALLEVCEQPTDCQAFLNASTDDDLGRALRRVLQLFTRPAKPDRSVYASVRALMG